MIHTHNMYSTIQDLSTHSHLPGTEWFMYSSVWLLILDIGSSFQTDEGKTPLVYAKT